MKLHRAVLALGVQGHDLTLRSAGTLQQLRSGAFPDCPTEAVRPLQSDGAGQHRHELWHAWLWRPVPQSGQTGLPGGTDEDGHRARTFHRVQATRGGWPHHYADAWLRHRDVPLSCSGWLWCQFTPPVCHDTGHAHRAWQVWSELGYGLNDEGTPHSYGQCHSKASL